MRTFNAADWQIVPIHTTGTVSAVYPALGRAAYRSNVLLEIQIEKEDAPGTFVFFALGNEFDFFFDRSVRLRFQCPANTVIYRYVPSPSSFAEDASEVDFVNIDSMPEQSGHVQQILSAMRAQELRHRNEMVQALIAVGRAEPIEPVMPAANADGDTDV